MNNIFISYRRNDTENIVVKIYDNLSYHFRKENLFFDIDTIPLGTDFRAYIKKSISKSTILLVIIGKNWLDPRKGKNISRLYEKNDFVRIEIEMGIQRGIPVIPILVDGAKIPQKEQLPDTIKELVFNNGYNIRYGDFFNSDIKKLVRILNNKFLLPKKNHLKRFSDNTIRRIKKFRLTTIFIILLLAVSGGEAVFYMSNYSLENKSKVIIEKNINGDLSGEEFIKGFYFIVKTINLTDSYELFSKNAQKKLSFTDYRNWWGRTVKSVQVDNVKNIGENQYMVKLSYKKIGGGLQCSNDKIILSKGKNGWLINDFTWGDC